MYRIDRYLNASPFRSTGIFARRVRYQKKQDVCAKPMLGNIDSDEGALKIG